MEWAVEAEREREKGRGGGGVKKERESYVVSWWSAFDLLT